MKEIIITAKNEKQLHEIMSVLWKSMENGELKVDFNVRRDW